MNNHHDMHVSHHYYWTFPTNVRPLNHHGIHENIWKRI